MDKEYSFSIDEIESHIQDLPAKGVTELSVHDESFAGNKNRILKFADSALKNAPDIFYTILIDASIIDREIINAFTKLFCSLEIPLNCKDKSGHLLFDKKFYASKARLLNESGIVFGFQLKYAAYPSDTLKLFLERMDFAVQQYPNHIDFPQIENNEIQASVTGFFSAQDIRHARDTAFSTRTFYSAGRAVPWFLSLLKPLKIYPSRFFEDFAEWQRCNNCDFKSGFSPEAEKHEAIEKMQLLFIEEKYEEKKCHELLAAAKDIIKINGAYSRLVGEGEESIVETSYNPDDLFGPESMDLKLFVENVCMENCRTKFFINGNNPDYAIE